MSKSDRSSGLAPSIPTKIANPLMAFGLRDVSSRNGRNSELFLTKTLMDLDFAVRSHPLIKPELPWPSHPECTLMGTSAARLSSDIYFGDRIQYECEVLTELSLHKEKACQFSANGALEELKESYFKNDPTVKAKHLRMAELALSRSCEFSSAPTWTSHMKHEISDTFSDTYRLSGAALGGALGATLGGMGLCSSLSASPVAFVACEIGHIVVGGALGSKIGDRIRENKIQEAYEIRLFEEGNATIQESSFWQNEQPRKPMLFNASFADQLNSQLFSLGMQLNYELHMRVSSLHAIQNTVKTFQAETMPAMGYGMARAVMEIELDNWANRTPTLVNKAWKSRMPSTILFEEGRSIILPYGNDVAATKSDSSSATQKLLDAFETQNYLSKENVSRLTKLGRGLVVASLASTGYSIMTSENKLKETAHQGVLLTGGTVGGIGGGVAGALLLATFATTGPVIPAAIMVVTTLGGGYAGVECAEWLSGKIGITRQQQKASIKHKDFNQAPHTMTLFKPARHPIQANTRDKHDDNEVIQGIGGAIAGAALMTAFGRSPVGICTAFSYVHPVAGIGCDITLLTVGAMMGSGTVKVLQKNRDEANQVVHSDYLVYNQASRSAIVLFKQGECQQRPITHSERREIRFDN